MASNPPSQVRTFTYDSLSQLLQSDQPETGTIKFTYDLNGNVKRKDDGRGEILNVVYDGLNRPTHRSYPAGLAQTPPVKLEYDLDLRPSGVTDPNYSKGQLVRVKVGTGTAATNQYTMQLFDADGRVLRAEQIVGTGSYVMQHEYDLAGQMTAAVYPSSPVRRVNYTINQLGQVTEIRDGSGKTLASGAEYAAHGALTKLVLGNGLIEKMTPNARLQPLKIELGSAATADEVGSFTFGYSGSTCVAGQTWANNGNVVSQAIKVGTSTFTQSYGYDGLNRLTCAKEGTAWEQRYGLDVYGNRWLTLNTLPMTSALTAGAGSNWLGRGMIETVAPVSSLH